MRRHRTNLAKFRVDDTRDVADMRLLRFSLGSPVACDSCTEVEALDRVGKITHEVPPPQLTVGEDLETEFLLLREHAEDVLVLDGFQCRPIGSLTRLEQFSRAQKTAHVVSPIRYFHVIVFPCVQFPAQSDRNQFAGALWTPRYVGVAIT